MNTTKHTNDKTSRTRTIANNCVATCQKLIVQIENAKNSLLAEFRDTIAAPEQLLRLALSEAEALAWQSGFPQLVFPTLAREKAQAVVAWDAHQRTVRSTSL
jgi:hypothetical protein